MISHLLDSASMGMRSNGRKQRSTARFSWHRVTPAYPGYITFQNGTVITIEEVWKDGPQRPCCYDFPPDVMLSVDPHFSVYTSPGCTAATKTCKWPARILSIWVCGCEGEPSSTSLVTPKPPNCCGNVVVRPTATIGAPPRPSCEDFDDRGVFLGRGIPVRLECYHQPPGYRGVYGE